MDTSATSRFTRTAALLAAFLLLLNCAPAFSQSSAWSTGGPYSSDRIHNMVASPSNPDVLFAAGDQGIYKSADGGATWEQLASGYFFSVAVSASNPDIVYAGSYEDGVFKSEDGGFTWSETGPSGARITALAVHPTNPARVYAGAGSATNYGSGVVRGIFKSDDGAASWTLKHDDNVLGIRDLLIDTSNPDYIYASVAREGNSRRYLARSTDGGESWEGFLQYYEALKLAMTPEGYATPTLYTVSFTDDIRKSVDHGETWTSISSPDPGTFKYIRTILVDPMNPDILYVGYRNHVYVSQNGGASWATESNGLPTSTSCYATDLTVHPVTHNVLMACRNGQGVFRSEDGGSNFALVGQTLAPANIPYLDVHPTDAQRLYAVQPGDDEQVRASSDGGTSWFVMEESPDDRGAVTIDPQEPSVVWVGQGYRETSSFYVHRSPDYGNSWSSHRFARTNSSSSTTMEVTDIIIHPGDSNKMLVGTNFDITWLGAIDGLGVLARSLDGGAIWTRLGSLLSATMKLHPGNPNTLYVGKIRSTEIFEVTDVWGSYQSTNITPPGVQGDIHDIEVGVGGNVVVAASDGLRIWNGTTWTLSTTFPVENVTALVIDHAATPGVIYAGTSDPSGVYVSEDGGLTWADYGDGLTFKPVKKLVLSEGYLFAGTEFGGVWKREAIATVLAAPEAPGLVSPVISATGLPVDVTLGWTVAARADDYQVQLSTSGDFSSLIVDQSSLAVITFDVTGLDLGTTYYWRVRAQNGTGQSAWSATGIFTISGVANDNPVELPVEFSLAQNYPNPFNPSTTIEFDVPVAARIRLTVHDALGRRVATLVDQVMDAGVHRAVFSGRNLSSGSYLYRLDTPQGAFTKTLMLLK